MLDPDAIAAFERDGFVAVRGAVPRAVVEQCQVEIDTALMAAGVDPTDPTTWTRPVVRLACPTTQSFAEAGTQPGLCSVYDQLLGEGAWRRWPGVGGTLPVRFPHPEDPGDAGWHIDGSFAGPPGADGGAYWINLASRERGLLALFLFSDIGENDAPTEVKVGSHLDIPAILEPFGDAGAGFMTVAQAFSPSTLARPSAFVTGCAGDVFVCHPFLVHRATWPHRGTHPRAIAQPGIALHNPFTLSGDDACPVEQAILAGLGRR